MPRVTLLYKFKKKFTIGFETKQLRLKNCIRNARSKSSTLFKAAALRYRLSKLI